MPFRWKDSVKNFKMRLDQDSGLPVATVEQIGNGRWIMACPLCGCGHDATNHKSPVYAPACASGDHTPVWSPYRASWIAQHPTAAQHSTIMLVSAEALESIPEMKEPAPLELVEKPKRARRKQAAA